MHIHINPKYEEYFNNMNVFTVNPFYLNGSTSERWWYIKFFNFHTGELYKNSDIAKFLCVETKVFKKILKSYGAVDGNKYIMIFEDREAVEKAKEHLETMLVSRKLMG